MGRVFEDITKTVGRTPLVRINRLTEGIDSTVLAKLEEIGRASCRERV